MDLKINKKDKGVSEVSVVIKNLKDEYDHAATHFKQSVEVKGFRKGQAPISKIKEKVGEEKLSNEVLNHIYPNIVNKAVSEFKLVPVMQPKIKINKLSEKDGLDAVVIFVERPKIKLADYKKLSKQAHKDVESETKTPKIETAKNMAEAKQKANEAPKNIKDEPTKEQKVLQKIYDLVIEKSTIDLPDIMVEEEVNRMLSNFLNYLARLKINFADYLKQANTTIDKIKEDYKKQATKNLKLEFVLSELSKVEKIKVEKSEIDEVIKNTPDQKQKEYLKQPQQQYYIESQLLKSKAATKLLEYAGIKLQPKNK